MYHSSAFDEVRTAIADFSANVQDPKAAIISSYLSYQGNQFINQGLFYDSPTAPSGIFDSFINIPSISSDLKTRSYVDMILSSTSNGTAGFR
jgi:hypothetical protein